MARVLDLFCGAGGAAMGYYRAGFEVIGVDIDPQPDYPFKFIRCDALHFLNLDSRISGISTKHVALVHASPPCQAYTATQNMPNANKDHPRLIEPVRELLKLTDLPYVIENVVRAPLIEPARMCGSSFGLGVQYDGPSAPAAWYQLQRHRYFETNWGLETLACKGQHTKPVIGIYGHHPAYNRRKYGVGKGQFSRKEKVELGQRALGIDWTDSWQSLKEAIPPMYTEYVGKQFLS